MPLAVDLEARFGAGGFDLVVGIKGLGGLIGGVTVPTLSLHAPETVDLDALSTDRVLGTVGDLEGIVGGALDGFPDLAGLLGPLDGALAALDLVGRTDVNELLAELEAALRPPEAGLADLVSATTGLGAVPGVRAVTDGLGALGLDLRAPGALLSGAAGGAVSLLQLVGALMGVEATSAEIDRRLALAAELLAADRLLALTGRVRSGGGAALAGLLDGVDPDDPGVVDIVAAPIEAYAGTVRELVDASVRGLAFAEATVVHADFDALVTELAVATAGLQEPALAPVRALVASAQPVIDLVAGLQVPDVGPDALVEASATLAGQLQTLIDGAAPSIISGLVDQVLDPVLTPVRAVNAVVEDVVATVDAAFRPIRDALAAIDLAPVADALETVTRPVQDAVDAIESLLTASQAAVQNAVNAVVGGLATVEGTLTSARDAITAPFAEVHGVLSTLDLAALQATLEQTIGTVASAVRAAPVRPVFDVASGVISTGADALSLVPKALLPDDLKADLEAACAPVQAINLEPTRALLHDELAKILATIDATALQAVQAGYEAVQDFIAGIDPEPLAAELDTGAFAVLTQKLDALDPEALLAEPLAALDAVRGALDGIDLAALFEPVDAGLDTVQETIAALDPAALVAPVEEALEGVRTTVADALQLDGWTAQLEAVDAAVAAFVARVDPAGPLAELQARWSLLLAPLREAGPSIGGALIGGLLGPRAGSAAGGGLPEVLAWIRGERDGSAVVRGRLSRAADRATASRVALGAVDLPGAAGEMSDAYAALTTAINALPAESLLRTRLEVTILATDPRAELAVVTANLGGASDRFGAAAATIAATTPPDRSEVALVAGGLGAAFAPWSPALAIGRRLLAVVGITEPAPNLGAALADALESIGPEPILAPFAAIVETTLGRLTQLVHDGVVAPLTSGVAELQALLDALSVQTLLGDIEGVRTDLLALVEGIRPATVLAGPITTFEDLRHTLATLDPLAPVRIAVATLRATADRFTAEFAPSVLLAPVIAVYDDIAALVGAFDVAGLLEPVLGALNDLDRQVDEGMDEVIDALERLKAACSSDGGPIPGLDLSVAVSVDVGGALGL
jgi:hypothetical protein